MRWVFLCLLMVNVGYFVLQTQFSETPAVEPPLYVNASDAGGVQLLRERDGSSERDLEVVEVLSNPVEEVSAPATSIETESDPEAIAEVEDPATCWRLGAFTDLTMTQDIAERAASMGPAVEIKAIDAPTGDYDYRVVIPPLSSMQEAFRRLRELKNRNIDSYVMAQGEDAQGISLGLFSTETAAQRHQQNMKDLGYRAEMRSIARVSRTYWIYTAGGPFPASILDNPQLAQAGIAATETDCLN